MVDVIPFVSDVFRKFGASHYHSTSYGIIDPTSFV